MKEVYPDKYKFRSYINGLSGLAAMFVGLGIMLLIWSYDSNVGKFAIVSTLIATGLLSFAEQRAKNEAAKTQAEVANDSALAAGQADL